MITLGSYYRPVEEGGDGTIFVNSKTAAILESLQDPWRV